MWRCQPRRRSTYFMVVNLGLTTDSLTRRIGKVGNKGFHGMYVDFGYVLFTWNLYPEPHLSLRSASSKYPGTLDITSHLHLINISVIFTNEWISSDPRDLLGYDLLWRGLCHIILIQIIVWGGILMRGEIPIWGGCVVRIFPGRWERNLWIFFSSTLLEPPFAHIQEWKLLQISNIIIVGTVEICCSITMLMGLCCFWDTDGLGQRFAIISRSIVSAYTLSATSKSGGSVAR